MDRSPSPELLPRDFTAPNDATSSTVVIDKPIAAERFLDECCLPNRFSLNSFSMVPGSLLLQTTVTYQTFKRIQQKSTSPFRFFSLAYSPQPTAA